MRFWFLRLYWANKSSTLYTFGENRFEISFWFEVCFLRIYFDVRLIFRKLFGILTCIEKKISSYCLRIQFLWTFYLHTTSFSWSKRSKILKIQISIVFFFFFNSPHPIVNFTWVRIISFEIQIIPFIIRNITFQIQNKEIIYENYIRNLQITCGNYAVMIFTANLTLCHSMLKSPLILHFLRKMSEEEIFQIKFLCESLNTRNVYS